jgi:hypothetical protein
MTSKPFTTFLWFDTQGEEAARALDRAYAGE